MIASAVISKTMSGGALMATGRTWPQTWVLSTRGHTASVTPLRPTRQHQHRDHRSNQTSTTFYCHCQRLKVIIVAKNVIFCFQMACTRVSLQGTHPWKLQVNHDTFQSVFIMSFSFYSCFILLYVYRKSFFYPKVETLTLASMQTLFIIFWSSLSSQQHFEKKMLYFVVGSE